jgi:hypothetical protein
MTGYNDDHMHVTPTDNERAYSYGALFGLSGDALPRTIRDELSLDTRHRFDRLTGQLGPIGAVTLEMLAEDVWEAAHLAGYNDGYGDAIEDATPPVDTAMSKPDTLFDVRRQVVLTAARPAVLDWIGGTSLDRGWQALPGYADTLVTLDEYRSERI